jgi:ElaB/YqjD/DUF883 family membrane-anchored ribosome-binding protein
MKLFGKKKKEDPIDDRTPVEKRFEDTGQKVGKKAGEIAQKGLNKFNEVKDQLEEDGTIDKVKEKATKAAKKTDEFFKKAEDKAAQAVKKVTKKNEDE